MEKLVLILFLALSLFAKNDFKVAWSIYVGWTPWDYAYESGIVEKYAKKEGIKVEFKRLDYIASIELYTAGEYDACVMTNMDMLAIPSVGGKKSEVLIIGDYSNGNDAIISKKYKKLKEIKDKKIYLEEFSVSHYLFAKALEKLGAKEQKGQVIKASEADIATLFLSDKSVSTVATWNPIVMQLMGNPKAVNLFDSSQIPYEILDLMVVAKGSDARLKRVLRNVWNEVLKITLDKKHPKHKDAIAYMAKVNGCTKAELYKQLSTTHFFSAEEEKKFRNSKKLVETMDSVRKFLFDRGLFGDLKSVDAVGMKFKNSTLGNQKNIQVEW